MEVNNINAMDCVKNVADFYSIENDGNEKVVHIHGYFYSEGEDCGNGEYRIVDYTWFIIPLHQFINLTRDDLADMGCNIKQYEEDLTEDKVKQYILNYFDDGAPMLLTYEDITMETPCGHYVDMRGE